jgi:hypothetical protein
VEAIVKQRVLVTQAPVQWEGIALKRLAVELPGVDLMG